MDNNDYNLLFDEEYYVSQFPERKRAKMKRKGKDALLEHYLKKGWKQGKNPSAVFDNDNYISAYGVDRRGRKSPLEHYVTEGAAAGNFPNLLFQADAYIGEHAGDPDYTGNPLTHYITVGYKKNYKPHYYFDTEYYMANYMEGVDGDPLTHYLTEGWKKHNKCHPTFFAEELYTAANQVPEGEPPIVHYLRTGIHNPMLSPYSIIHTDEYRQTCKEYGEKYGVTSTIYPDDMTLIFHIFHDDFKMDYRKAVDYYFWDAKRCYDKLVADLEQSGFDTGKQFSLLEFASGFGRMSRLLATVDNIDLTASDIHPKAIGFLRDELHVNAVQSAANPADFAPPQKYDVIFCLSFFSHMPKSTWIPWLQRLYECLNDGGRLVITVHGMTMYEVRKGSNELDKEGFHFHPETEQLDLSTEDYGFTITNEAYVTKAVGQLTPPAEIAVFVKDDFWKIQDAYVIKSK